MSNENKENLYHYHIRYKKIQYLNNEWKWNYDGKNK
jgi:hypothetical protein